ncbi:hypothetical protein [Dictyobacter aurantiacus]|uniref:hypothetical protein n=1 Tax=Dictyobacter aurantiacus TaxID=1936993 RepID=UPI000F839C87|nr:hypothetical protein [Dictyobacter aurantiacus]
MFSHVARLSILMAQQEKNFLDLAHIFLILVAWLGPEKALFNGRLQQSRIMIVFSNKGIAPWGALTCVLHAPQRAIPAVLLIAATSS